MLSGQGLLRVIIFQRKRNLALTIENPHLAYAIVVKKLNFSLMPNFTVDGID